MRFTFTEKANLDSDVTEAWACGEEHEHGAEFPSGFRKCLLMAVVAGRKDRKK